MRITKAKKIAAQLLKVGYSKVWIDPEKNDKVKESVTKEDVRGLIADGAIKKRKDSLHSMGRSKKLRVKKSKGRKGAHGKRKGTKKTREGKSWKSKVRSQRKQIKILRKEGKINKNEYRDLYNKVKGNFFRGKKHILLQIGKGAESEKP